MKANYWTLLLPVLIVQGMIQLSHSKYINTPCEAHSDCGLNNHLQCINNFCQCDSNSQIYDQSTQKCLLLAGQQCQLQHDDQYNRQHSIPIKCVPNSECANSVCGCTVGYRFSPDFLCKPDFGTACYVSEDCDDTLGLVCSNQGICDCYNATLTYQGQFGCVDPKDPTFNEMLRLLNQTDRLLKENGLELKDVFNDLGLQNDENSSGEEEMSTELRNILASERQFHDTYNTNDLQFAAQNDAPAQQGGGGGGGNGLNFQQLLQLFQTFQSFIPRNNNNNGGGGGGGGGGFFRNLFGGGNNNNNQGGYAESSSPAPAPGYGPPGQPEMGMGMRMGLLARFLDVFNRMIPIVRELRMRFMPLRFFRNLLNRFSPSTTAAPPPAQSIINPSPEVIQTNGNYRQNPIFGQPLQAAPPNQGGGGGQFRFFMRARERFRNFLRGNNQGSQGGYPAAKPESSYGPPEETPPPPADGAEPAGGVAPGTDSPPPPAPASSSQHNTYLTNHRPPPSTTPHRSHHNQFQGQSTQAHYNTIQIGGHQAIPPPRTQNPGVSLPSSPTYNSGQHPNHDSFFDGQGQQSFNNQPIDNPNNNQYNAQAQATSHHHQSTFVAHHQKTGNQPKPPPPQPPQNHNHHPNIPNSNSHPRPPFPSIGSGTPPPIPQVKLQIPHHHPSTKIPSLSDNFILSEADDPHPGFTPHSTLAPPLQESYRTSARFERIGLNEQQHHEATRIAQNWRETF